MGLLYKLFRRSQGAQEHSPQELSKGLEELAAAPVAGASRLEEQGFPLAAQGDDLDSHIFESLRRQVPIIDACIEKIVRLTGDFTLESLDGRFQGQLDRFCREVPVGISGKGINTFADMYLDSLLTYGRAVGRIFADHERLSIRGLYVGDPTIYRITSGRDPLDLRVFAAYGGGEIVVRHPQRLLYTTLNPNPKNPQGVSLLRGLPAISDVLMKIYRCIGQNFDRAGNVRYAVTYRPGADAGDKVFAKERAMAIAKEWSSGMAAAKSGVVKDFISVGDVDIKVIGADSKVIDTQVPVRQLLEQIVAKLSIPPFLLGLNWSTTEKMSSQQSDILTSELEYYRRLLSPVIKRVGDAFLRLCGDSRGCEVKWENINLQDEVALAEARLANARAAAIEGAKEDE